MQLAGLRLLAAAVIPIQAAMRMFLARRERLNRMWAVIVMQSYMRRWLCERKFASRINSVIAIQKTYRGWLARDLVEDQHYCATQIQRIVRGYMATLSVYESIYKVTLVQSFVRMKLAIDEATYRMALIIQVQSIIRGYLVRKNMEVVTTSATLIQAAWRGYYSCMTYQYDVLDIIIVQSLVRRRSAILYTEQKRQDRLDRSATLIQAQWRSYDCTIIYLHYLADVLTVQSVVRRWQACKKYQEKVDERKEEEARRKERAATKIQQTWRGFICYADYMFTVSDIVVVQSQVRCWLAARERARMEHAREVEAATDIQRHWRGSLGRDEAIMRLIEIIICQVQYFDSHVAGCENVAAPNPLTYYFSSFCHRALFVASLLEQSAKIFDSRLKRKILPLRRYRVSTAVLLVENYSHKRRRSRLSLMRVPPLDMNSTMRQ